MTWVTGLTGRELPGLPGLPGKWRCGLKPCNHFRLKPGLRRAGGCDGVGTRREVEMLISGVGCMSALLINRDGGFAMPADGWYQLAPLGEFAHAQAGVVQVVDRAACEAMAGRFAEEARTPNFAGALIDFDHFSLDGEKRSKAAGWITALDARCEGSGFGVQGERNLTQRRRAAGERVRGTGFRVRGREARAEALGRRGENAQRATLNAVPSDVATAHAAWPEIRA